MTLLYWLYCYITVTYLHTWINWISKSVFVYVKRFSFNLNLEIWIFLISKMILFKWIISCIIQRRNVGLFIKLKYTWPLYTRKKFKQWWSISPIFKKLTISSRLNSLNVEIDLVGKPGPGLRRAQRCVRVKLVDWYILVLKVHVDVKVSSFIEKIDKCYHENNN